MGFRIFSNYIQFFISKKMGETVQESDDLQELEQ